MTGGSGQELAPGCSRRTSDPGLGESGCQVVADSSVGLPPMMQVLATYELVCECVLGYTHAHAHACAGSSGAERKTCTFALGEA